VDMQFSTHVSEKGFGSTFMGQTGLENFLEWRGNRQVAPKRRNVTTNLRCVTSQKSEGLTFCVVEFEKYIVAKKKTS
jgi:hypothetical protein